MGVGNFSEAINFLDKASEIAERLRDYRQWGESAALRAWTTYLVSDFEDSRARFDAFIKWQLRLVMFSIKIGDSGDSRIVY